MNRENKEALAIVDDCLRILLKATAYDKLVIKLQRFLSGSYGTAAQLAAYEVIEKLSGGKSKLKENDIDQAEKILSEKLGTEFAATVEAEMFTETELYYQKTLNPAFTPAQNANITAFNLNMTDYRAIKQLTKGNHIWMKNHALNSNAAKDITAELIKARELKLTRDQTAKLLHRKFGNLVPKDIADRYGEDRYWDGFIKGHATRTKGFAEIEKFERIGTTHYKIYSRMSERTCPICRRMHAQVYAVADAKKRIETYYKASENGDISGMKKALPWQTEETAPNKKPLPGLLPSFHFRCECRIESYQETLKSMIVSGGKKVNIAKAGRTYHYLDRGQHGEYDPPEKKKSKIVYSVLDNTGKEFVVTEDTIAHCKKKINGNSHKKLGVSDPIGYTKIVGAVRDPEFKAKKPNGDLVLTGKNGYIVIMRDNVVHTSYFAAYSNPKNLNEAKKKAKKHFENNEGAEIYE